MARVKPFRALRYDERRAGPVDELVAPPYDVITPEGRERYLEASRYNVANLIGPESPERAQELLGAWRHEGVLVEDAEPAYWWLRQQYEGPDGVTRTREGFVAAVGLEPYSSGVIRPHERTYPAPKEAQLRILRAVRTVLSPIMLLYDDPANRARRALEPHATGEPLFEAREGSSASTLWRIDDRGAIDEVTRALAEHSLLIADGHHRYETALALHDEEGSEETGFTMAVLFNSHGEGLTIFPTHRVFRELSSQPDFAVKRRAEEPRQALLELEQLARGHAAFVLYQRGSAWVVEEPGESVPDTVLVDRLGLNGVSYTPRVDEAIGLVDSGEAEAAFLLRAPTIEQVEAIAQRGETMPQKSTYFFPKLLSGLLFMPLGTER